MWPILDVCVGVWRETEVEKEKHFLKDEPRNIGCVVKNVKCSNSLNFKKQCSNFYGVPSNKFPRKFRLSWLSICSLPITKMRWRYTFFQQKESWHNNDVAEGERFLLPPTHFMDVQFYLKKNTIPIY